MPRIVPLPIRGSLAARRVVEEHWQATTEESSVVTGIEAEVCADIAQRQALGIKKYPTPLADHAKIKERLQCAYEECLDQAVYLKWAIRAFDKKDL